MSNKRNLFLFFFILNEIKLIRNRHSLFFNFFVEKMGKGANTYETKKAKVKNISNNLYFWFNFAESGTKFKQLISNV